jgi:hypothetical protein
MLTQLEGDLVAVAQQLPDQPERAAETFAVAAGLALELGDAGVEFADPPPPGGQ